MSTFNFTAIVYTLQVFTSQKVFSGGVHACSFGSNSRFFGYDDHFRPGIRGDFFVGDHHGSDREGAVQDDLGSHYVQEAFEGDPEGLIPRLQQEALTIIACFVIIKKASRIREAFFNALEPLL